VRIGIDFDNTIICYDQVFCELAIDWQLVPSDFNGTKQQLRDQLQALPEGDTVWQKLQGKVYGEYIDRAMLFTGITEFLMVCRQLAIPVFIVSHKTEYGHFDEKRILLRDVSRQWLDQQGFFRDPSPLVNTEHVFFEPTREDKIARIKHLQCTHFIDDLIEVLGSPLFPTTIQRILFKPLANASMPESNVNEAHALQVFSSWKDIRNALFNSN